MVLFHTTAKFSIIAFIGCEALLTVRNVVSYGYGTRCVSNTPHATWTMSYFYLTLARTMAGLPYKDILIYLVLHPEFDERHGHENGGPAEPGHAVYPHTRLRII